MTTDEELATSPRRRPRTRTIAALAVAAVLVVGAAVAYGVVRHLDGQYGPIVVGESGGPAETSNKSLRPLDGGSGFDSLIVGPVGTRVVFWAAADNRGDHSVVITSVDRDENETRVRWALPAKG